MVLLKIATQQDVLAQNFRWACVTHSSEDSRHGADSLSLQGETRAALARCEKEGPELFPTRLFSAWESGEQGAAQNSSHL